MKKIRPFYLGKSSRSGEEKNQPSTTVSDNYSSVGWGGPSRAPGSGAGGSLQMISLDQILRRSPKGLFSISCIQ